MLSHINFAHFFLLVIELSCLQHAEYRKQNSPGHGDNENIRDSRLYHESRQTQVRK